MLDYTDRVDELCSFVQTAFGITDRTAVEVLASSFLTLDGVDYPVVILDTDWTSRYFKEAWFGFAKPQPISLMRVGGIWRRAGVLLADWTEQTDGKRPLVLIEPEWRVPVKWPYKVRPYVEEFLAVAVRIRVHQPKTIPVWPLDAQAILANQARLEHLSGWLLSSVGRSRKVPAGNLPSGFLYLMELLAKLIRPWPGFPFNRLTSIIASTAVRRAALYGRDRLEASDWAAAARVAAWMIPPWTGSLIEHAWTPEGISCESFAGSNWRAHVGADAGLLDRQVVRKEIARLVSAGVAVCYKNPFAWRLPHEARHHLRALVRGEAFGLSVRVPERRKA